MWSVMYGMMNVMTGVFVDMAIVTSQVDNDFIKQQEDKKHKLMLKEARDLFYACDDDQSGSLSIKEFKEHVSDPVILSYFSTLGMDADEATDFFMIQADENGEMRIDKF